MTPLDKLLLRRDTWLKCADGVLLRMLESNGPYPLGDVIEAEINIDLLTTKIAVLDSAAADDDEGGAWADGYIDRRIPQLLQQLKQRRTTS